MVRGCEKFVPALAYLFCLALPWSCLARFAHYLAGLCSRQYQRVGYVIYTDLLLKVALDWSTWIQWIGHPRSAFGTEGRVFEITKDYTLD